MRQRFCRDKVKQFPFKRGVGYYKSGLTPTIEAGLNLVKSYKYLLPINLPRITSNYLASILKNHIISYPTPISLTYAWSFGSLAGICLIIQMLTGLLLSTSYTPKISLAFLSVDFIMRDVKNGWFLRYTHSNGASMFFIVIYAHMLKAMWYGSYMKPRGALWCSGVVIMILLMATAFTGYILPWGQLGFWGATVITNMVTIVPYAGKKIMEWFWGGYVIKEPTLKRFFMIHFVMPFLLAGAVLIHLALLHRVGSNSPIGSDSGVDDVQFYPYFLIKDIHALFLFLGVFGFLVFYHPNLLGHTDNYVPANPMKTPKHVSPEWYFLPFYAMLRAIPFKTPGILAMAGSMLILLSMPYTNTSYVRNTSFRPLFKVFFFMFIADVVILTWVGWSPAEKTYIRIGLKATIFYYIFFMVLFPLSGKIEDALVCHKPTNQKQSTAA